MNSYVKQVRFNQVSLEQLNFERMSFEYVNVESVNFKQIIFEQVSFELVSFEQINLTHFEEKSLWAHALYYLMCCSEVLRGLIIRKSNFFLFFSLFFYFQK